MSANLTQRETETRAADVEVRRYRVTVDLSEAQDQTKLDYAVTSQIDLSCASGRTWIDFLDGEVQEVMVDGQPIPFSYDGARIELEVHAGLVEVRARARYSRTGEGLHRFVDPADGQTYLYTQYEPADARRVFPNFEQPDIRAPFEFVVTGPSAWWFGSNQPIVQRIELPDSLVRVEFAQTKTMSTYITCLCAGPYYRVERQGAGLQLGLLCRASLAQYLDHDALFRYTEQAFNWYADNFGPYPWGEKYDQIFVPEYNLGAMENPGLVTFTESYLYRSQPTPAQLQSRANTLAHEMSHMWFGDLVTCQWWGDLWLKESFAEYMGSEVSVEACGFEDGWANFAANRKVGAYLADVRPSTHPIVAQIADLEAAKTNFDRITYSKGSAALTQLVHFIGQDAFLAGARRYFAAHHFGSATLADFVAALSQETSEELNDWVEGWLKTSGHDRLAAVPEVGEDGRLKRLTVQRSTPAQFPANRAHATTVGLYRLIDGQLTLDRRIEVRISADTTELPEAIGAPVPDLVLINDLDHTFAEIALTPADRELLLARLPDLAPISRAVAWNALWSAVRSGELPVAEFVAAVSRAEEPHTGILAGVLDWTRKAILEFVSPTTSAVLAEDFCTAARAAVFSTEPGTAEQLLWAKAYLRTCALTPQDPSWLLRGEGPGLEISVDLMWLTWMALAAQGRANATSLDEVLSKDQTAAGKLARLTCWASQPAAEIKAEAWSMVLEPAALSNAELEAVLVGFNAPGQGRLRAPFAESYFSQLTQIWAAQPIEMALRVVGAGFPDDGATAGRAWLEENPTAAATLRRLVADEAYEADQAAQLRLVNSRR